MTTLYGTKLTRDHLRRHVGHMSQICGIRAGELTAGPAKGVEVLDVRTGTGFEYSVLPGRGLDIAWASYRGLSVGYITKAGVVAPENFVEDGATGFLNNFFAGLLTTAGLSNIGVPDVEGGKAHGLHGRIGNTRAEDVSVRQGWVGDAYEMAVSGVVRQARPFGECLVLRREIVSRLGESRLVIRDSVENAGVTSEPVLLLYHCNFGYPVVSPTTRLHTSGGAVEGRDVHAAGFLDSHDRFDEPTASYPEQCFYHHLEGQPDRATAALYNDEIGIGAYVRYRTETLPLLVEWKMMGEQDYVVGLEPSTARLEGRTSVLEEGPVQMIEPGESVGFEVEIGVIDGAAELKALMG